MRKSGFLITPRQADMLRAVVRTGEPFPPCPEAKHERTHRTLVDRGFIEDAREIAEDGQTIIVPAGGPWRVTQYGCRALEEFRRRQEGRT